MSGRRRPACHHWLGSVARPTRARLCGTPCRTERRSGTWVLPSLWHATPSATFERLRGLVGSSPISWSLAACCVVLELRPLCSAGITRLHRYYGPLRHPTRPSLSLAGVSLAVTRRHRWGFPCCYWSPSTCMPSPLPRWDRRVLSLVLLAFSAKKRCALRRRPSPIFWRVGSHVALFGACSTFTSRYGLRGSRNRQGDPFHRRLRRFRYLHRRSDCFRLERPVAG